MKMKKFFALVLSGILALSLLTGCGGDEEVEEEYDDEEYEEVEEDVEDEEYEEEEVESEGEAASQESLENLAAAIVGTQAMIDTAVENYADAISEEDMTFLQEASDYLAQTNAETDPDTLTEDDAQALYAEIDGMATEVAEVLMAAGIEVEGAAAQTESAEAEDRPVTDEEWASIENILTNINNASALLNEANDAGELTEEQYNAANDLVQQYAEVLEAAEAMPTRDDWSYVAYQTYGPHLTQFLGAMAELMGA